MNVMPASRDVADFVAGPERDRKGSAIETEENDILEHFHEKLRLLLRGGFESGGGHAGQDAVEAVVAAIAWIVDTAISWAAGQEMVSTPGVPGRVS
jgi:hypothetical protein